MAKPASEDEYFMGRNTAEIRRLNEQHSILTETLTYLLHPRIAASIPPNAKIADVGTGTGIWLVELAPQLPSSTLIGYDTSSDQYPSASSLPSNVTLRTQPQSIFDEFPSSEQGTYDVVACRILISLMAVGQWEIALKNLISLLKPGGWIQWIDYDASSGLICGSYCSLVPGVNHRTWKELIEASAWFEKAFNRNFMGMANVGDMFTENWLEDVSEELWNTSRTETLRTRYSKMTFGVLKTFCAHLLALKDSGWSQERVDRVLGEIIGAVENEKAYISGSVYVVTGQKPT